MNDRPVPSQSPELSVLLIGNYPNDAQESMQRFAAMMKQGLVDSGIAVKLLLPPAWFGKGKRTDSGLGKWLGYIDKFILLPFFLKRAICQLRKDSNTARLIVHICDHSNAFYTKYLQSIPHTVTCHDLLAVRSALGEIPGNPTRWTGRQLQRMILSGLNQAQHINTVSEATRSDLLRLSKLKEEQVSTIPVALNYPYSPIPPEEALRRLEVLAPKAANHGFLFHVGGNQWYKNRMGVLRIYSRLLEIDPDAPYLLMAGKPFTDEMSQYVVEHELTERVISLENCDNEDLRALYSQAAALIFPSLAEGFGWPVIEAQACGCPVICGDRPPFPEVAGEAAIFCNPTDESTFAQAIQRLLDSPDQIQRLRETGLKNAARYAPATMIASYVETYGRLGTSA